METSNETEVPELEPRDELICALLAQGWTHRRAAEEVGCSTKTIQRLLRDPSFAEEVKRRRRTAVAATAAALAHLGVAAVSALGDLLASDDDRIRLRAIEMTLQMGRRFHREELIEDEVLARLDAAETHATPPPYNGSRP